MSDTNPVVIVGVGAVGPCILWTGYRDRNGYGTRSVGGRTVKVHRQAWTAVHGDPGTLCVCHRCDVRHCINVTHMFLGTQMDNMADKMAKGRHTRLTGEQNGNVKLTDDQVREIRASTESGVAIARRLGVSPSHVSRIRLHKQWVHFL